MLITNQTNILMIFKFCEVKHIILKVACLVFLIFLAMIKDLQSYKIGNSLILIGIILGLFFQLYETGWTGIIIWFGGVMLPILILAPLFLFKVFGAGDIKLFSVVGSFFGIHFVIKSIVFAFLIGGFLSIIHLVKYKQVFYRFHHLIEYIQNLSQINSLTLEGIKNFKIIPYYDVKKEGYDGVIHFSIAIFIAVLIQLLYLS